MTDFLDKIKSFSMKDLHGKTGQIVVGSDSEDDVHTEVTTFHCDDGNVYVISVISSEGDEI